MTLKNSSTQYGIISKSIHWITAVFIVCMLPLGFLLSSLQTTSWSNFSYCLHESIGIFILLLTAFRLLWHFQTKVPKLPAHMPSWQRRSARLSHHLLYIALIGMPLSGWVNAVSSGYPPKFLGLMTWSLPISANPQIASYSGSIHKFLAWTIIFLLSIHIFAALKHYFIDRDMVLQRILPKTWFTKGKLKDTIIPENISKIPRLKS